jgi:flagellar motor switch protein FliM
MLQIGLDTTMGEVTESMQLVFPYYTIEPFVPHMNPANQRFQEGAPTAAARGKWNPELNHVNLQVTAEWRELQLTALELSRLQRGDVLLMSPQHASQVQLCLAGLAKFHGRLGTSGRRWAVELTGQIEP